MKYCVLYIVLVLILSLVSISHSYAFQQHSLSIPAKNELLKPDSSALVKELKPLLEWKRQSPNTYVVHIYADSLLTDTVEVVNVVDTVYRLQKHLDFNKVYYWYVVGSGGSSTPSTVWTFHTFNPKVTLVSPADSLISFVKPSFLTWNQTEGIINYNVQVSTDSMFSRDFAIFALSHGDTTYPTTQLVKNRQYFWRVQPVIGPKENTWSEYRSFTIPDNNLIKVFPDSGLTMSTTLFALRWKGLEGANSYSVILADNAQLVAPIVIAPDVKDSFFVVQGLKQNTQYFWTITANTDIAVIPSTTWSFTILSKTVLSEPANGAMITSKFLSFKWRKTGSRNSSSFFQLSDTLDFSSIIQEVGGIKDTVFHYNGTYIFKQNTKYYWRVKQLIGSDTSFWSNTFSFITKPVQTTSQLYPETNASGVSLDTELQWKLKENVDSYVVRLSTNPTFEPLLFERNIYSQIAQTPLKQLEHNCRYYWQIRCRKDGEFSDWSPTWSFLTLMDKPSLLSPLNESEALPIFTTLTWQAVPGSERYHVQISKDSLFSIVAVDEPNISQRHYEFKTVEPETRYFWKVQSSSNNNQGQWSDVRTFTTKTISSVENDKNNEISISPNPVFNSSQIIVIIPLQYQLQQIKIRNLIGVEVASFSTQSFDVSFLPTGLYFVEIQTLQQNYIHSLHIIK